MAQELIVLPARIIILQVDHDLLVGRVGGRVDGLVEQVKSKARLPTCPQFQFRDVYKSRYINFVHEFPKKAKI